MLIYANKKVKYFIVACIELLAAAIMIFNQRNNKKQKKQKKIFNLE